jgi:hypothetical protein
MACMIATALCAPDAPKARAEFSQLICFEYSKQGSRGGANPYKQFSYVEGTAAGLLWH